MHEFNELWEFIVRRSVKAGIPVVQDRTELEYVFNLMRNCNSYLEVGTAEGNSLYVLANAMPKSSEITYIDLAEKHTEKHRNEILEFLKDYKVAPVHGDSNDFFTMAQVDRKPKYDQRNNIEFQAIKTYDAVLIDAGHDDFNVAIDAFLYGPLAQKYIFFHDIQIPDVNRAYEWYCRQRPECRNYRIVNSDTYGFGILELLNAV